MQERQVNKTKGGAVETTRRVDMRKTRGEGGEERRRMKIWEGR
jgi:hypothetical protein